MGPTLHQVFLMVSDIDPAVEFYEEGLGLPLRERGSRSATFETGGCSLVLEEDFDDEALAAFGMEPPGDVRGEGAIVVVEVKDVRAVHDTLVESELSINVLIEPREVDWGRELFLVEDPDGYTVEVSRPLASDDRM